MSATARPVSASILKPLARESDLRLVELSRTGDEQAFEALVRRHRHELHVYAARLMGAEGRAEDALQHALMSAWVALRDRGAEVANPRAWLYGIVHNSAVSVLRRARHDTVALNEALEAPHTHAGPETNVIVGEIFAGLAQMPAPQRHALLMTAVAGSSHGEAASALGVSDGAVRGMVYRARAALRQAAAAVFAPGLVNWAIGVGRRRPHLPVDPADAAAATSASAGVAAAVVKGGAVIAAVGALAGAAGPALLPAVSGSPHHRSAAAHRSAPTRHGSSGLSGTLGPSGSVNAHQSSARPHHALAAIAGRGEAEHSPGDGRGHEQGRGSSGQRGEHGERSGSGGSSRGGPGDTGLSNGDSSGSDSSGGSSSGSGSSNGGSSNGDSSGSGSSGSGSSGSGHGDTGSSGSGSSGSGHGESGSSGSGSSGSAHGDTGTPTTAAGSSAVSPGGSSGAGDSGPGPGGADQSSGHGGLTVSATAPSTTAPTEGSGGDDAGSHGDGPDGGHSGSGD